MPYALLPESTAEHGRRNAWLQLLSSCVQLLDISVLLQASLALFQAVPASVTLPLYPRHSAGDALLSGLGATVSQPLDGHWAADCPLGDVDEGGPTAHEL